MEQIPTEWLGLDKLAYLQGEPTARGMLKQQFADFKVSEELGFEMGGNGEHLFLYIKKQNLSTIEVARKIAAVAEARIAMVGYAGMKDKKAECTQWFSVPLQKEKGAVKENENQSIISRLEDENIKIISTVRNNRKLKIGSHKRNLFDITLRNCLEGREEFDANLDKIQQFGVPNYYGFQRFGRELSNLKQVDKLIHDPQTNTKRRQKSFKKGMLISAARAYVFNQVLSSRITNNNWSQFVAGDVINLCLLYTSPSPRD